MGYKPKVVGDKLNAERAATYAAPRRQHCPWCAVSGLGHHTLELTEDGTHLACPRCGDARPASDADRKVYGGGA